MNIIETISSKSLNSINIKELHRQELIQEQKEKLIDSLKGSKIYYKFVQKWTMPRYEIWRSKMFQIYWWIEEK